MNVIERYLGRSMTADELAIEKACSDIPGLAYVCITERVPLKAAERIARLMSGVLDAVRIHAAGQAADMLEMERRAPGSIVNDNDSRKH